MQVLIELKEPPKFSSSPKIKLFSVSTQKKSALGPILYLQRYTMLFHKWICRKVRCVAVMFLHVLQSRKAERHSNSSGWLFQFLTPLVSDPILLLPVRFELLLDFPHTGGSALYGQVAVE